MKNNLIYNKAQSQAEGYEQWLERIKKDQRGPDLKSININNKYEK